MVLPNNQHYSVISAGEHGAALRTAGTTCHTSRYGVKPTLRGEHYGRRFQVDLPDEILSGFGWQEEEVPSKLRETFVLELLRLDQLSEAQAAELLTLDRWELLEVMGRYRIPAVQMSLQELRREIAKEMPRDKRI